MARQFTTFDTYGGTCRPLPPVAVSFFFMARGRFATETVVQLRQRIPPLPSGTFPRQDGAGSAAGLLRGTYTKR